jgi:hypothetical protein
MVLGRILHAGNEDRDHDVEIAVETSRELNEKDGKEAHKLHNDVV